MDTPGRWPVIGTLTQWLRNWLSGQSGLLELDRAGEGEAARVAGDLGISTAELVRMAGRGSDAAELLRRRLEARHLDPAEVSRTQPEHMRDMSRLCSLCRSQGRCARDLSRNPNNPAWRGYCPNVGTLDSLGPTELPS